MKDMGSQKVPTWVQRKLRFYARQKLLVIDEVGYLSYSTRKGCAVVSTAAVPATIPIWIEAWNPRRIFCAYDATRDGDDAAHRLLRKDNRVVRVRPALDGDDWNDMLVRDRGGEPLETDDRRIS